MVTMIFLFLVCLALPNQIFPQSDPEQESLKGFDTLKVVVEHLEPDLEQAGLTRDQIQTDVEIKLRRAGFIVKGKNEVFFPYIYLYIQLTSFEKNSGFAFNIAISLKQEVSLSRNKSVSLLSATWDTNITGYLPKSDVGKLREAILAQVDLFINDYLKANGRTSNQSDELGKFLEEIRTPTTIKKNKQDDSPFTAVYVGGNKPPEVEVFNDSDKTLYLDLGQGVMTPYKIPSKTSRKMTLIEGNYNFKATAFRVRSLEGTQLFRKGYVYRWKFTIITVPR